MHAPIFGIFKIYFSDGQFGDAVCKVLINPSTFKFRDSAKAECQQIRVEQTQEVPQVLLSPLTFEQYNRIRKSYDTSIGVQSEPVRV